MNKKILSLVNQIKDICEYGVEPRGRHECLNSDRGEKVFIQGEEKIRKYHNLLEQIWKSDNEIYETIWDGIIRIEVPKIIVNSFRNDIPVDKELDNLINQLLGIEKQEWLIFMEIYGVNMETEKPLEFGQFTIYNWEKHRNIVVDKFKSAEPDPNAINKWIKEDTKYLISVAVTSRDSSRAKSLADEKFRQVENIFAYMHGGISHHFNIGIVHYDGDFSNRSISVSSSNMTSASTQKSGSHKIHLDKNIHFFDHVNGNHKIWEIARKINKSDIEKRLLIAVEWIGKGVNDLDDAKAFVQFIFAIEGLLKQNEGGIINASISSQISEFAAFLIGYTLEERIKIEKLCKNLYTKRSAIAHGGSQSITKEDLENALDLSKKLVIKILTSPEFSCINSINEIAEWIKKKRYS
ncbi:hypothetical protein [Clostridium diolis]|uniref:hypothetical protein n=1 Tax=Clostridium diolis TaxID=223919 RepID=UPI003AF8BAF2